MAWFSMHGGHSGEYCRHARGTLQEVIERAIGRGFTTYGLTEHAPRYHQQELFADEAGLSPADLAAMFEAYLPAARELQHRHAGRIEILVGFEAEPIPRPGEDWTQQTLDISRDGKFDYMVGSIHHIEGVFIDSNPEQTQQLAKQLGGMGELQRRYFQQVAEMVQRLRPQVVAHLDLVRKYDGFDASFDKPILAQIEGVLEVIRDVGSVLEVNAAPARRGTGPVYPLPGILQRACAMAVPVTLSDDSHGPADVGVGLDACMAALATAGYRQVHCLHRAPGGVEWAAVPLTDVRPA